MSDIYATPEADLGRQASGERAGGNIDDAVAGNIEIGMLETMGEAWRGMKGFKLKCHIALAIYFLVYFGAMLITLPVVVGMVALGADPNTAGLISWLVQMAAIIATMPMVFGVLIMGMRHYMGKSVSAGSIFDHFGRIPSLFLVYVLQTILITLGMLLLLIPGIYLATAYMFAMPLVVEKKMPAWRAMEVSRKALTRVWFRFFGIIWLIALINMLGLLTLGIAWIWTLPWSVLGVAMIYVKLFGAEAHTLAD